MLVGLELVVRGRRLLGREGRTDGQLFGGVPS